MTFIRGVQNELVLFYKWFKFRQQFTSQAKQSPERDCKVMHFYKKIFKMEYKVNFQYLRNYKKKGVVFNKYDFCYAIFHRSHKVYLT